MLIEMEYPVVPRVAKDGVKEMASVSSRGGKTLVRINSSSLSLLQECLRKSYYIFKKGFVTHNENTATLFGSAVHAALEVFYSGASKERKIPPNFSREMELWSKGEEPSTSKEFLVYRAAQAFLEKASPLISLEDSNKRSVTGGMWTLEHYFKTYIDDPYTVVRDSDGPMVERGCVFTLYEDDFLIVEYFGTVDVILKHERTGSILVTDHKTSSVVGQQFYNRLKPNHQYTGYLLAAREFFGLDTDKFLVNCIEVKAKPKTARGTPPNFPRQVTVRTEEDYAEFRAVVLYHARVLAALWDKPEEEWTLGPVSSCASYAGCQYLRICSSPQNLRKNIINAEFTETR